MAKNGRWTSCSFVLYGGAQTLTHQHPKIHLEQTSVFQLLYEEVKLSAVVQNVSCCKF